MKGWLVVSLAALALLPGRLSAEAAQPSLSRETHRIRIGNRPGGAIEISLDGGRDWVTVGHVLRPATETGPGFTALEAAEGGAVAAVSLDAITLRTDPLTAGAAARPRTIRLLPAGSAAAASDIETDLPRGSGIFGSLSPPLGSALGLESDSGTANPLPADYTPRVGDHLVIVARVPVSAPAMLVIENREGGRVLAVSSSGDETVVGQVRRPLRGVAGYASTRGALCGGVVSHHPGAIVVATTPPPRSADGPAPSPSPAAVSSTPGSGKEDAAPHSPAAGGFAGFRIEPAASAEALKPEDGSVLVVDRLTPSGLPLGLPITLSPASTDATAGSLTGETRVEARLDGGAWEPLPAIGGAAPDGLTAAALAKRFAALGTPRTFTEGVTHLRLILAPPTPERLRLALARCAVDGTARLADAPAGEPVPPASSAASRAARAKTSPASKAPVSRGGAAPHKATKTLRVVANIQGQGIAYVLFYLDGRMRKMTNIPPFEWLWDTRTTPNGTHALEIRGADAQGRIITTQTRKVTVYN
jgi:hypothetical protein